MQLTERDAQVVLAVAEYRALRREQIERLFFTSRNTANERLKRLYQNRFLQRRWLPLTSLTPPHPHAAVSCPWAISRLPPPPRRQDSEQTAMQQVCGPVARPP
jgi:hypothetical protein